MSQNLKELQNVSLAQQNYEDDLRMRPNYEDGTARPTWDELGKCYCQQTRDVVRNSWATKPIATLEDLIRD